MQAWSRRWQCLLWLSLSQTPNDHDRRNNIIRVHNIHVLSSVLKGHSSMFYCVQGIAKSFGYIGQVHRQPAPRRNVNKSPPVPTNSTLNKRHVSIPDRRVVKIAGLVDAAYLKISGNPNYPTQRDQQNGLVVTIAFMLSISLVWIIRVFMAVFWIPHVL